MRVGVAASSGGHHVLSRWRSLQLNYVSLVQRSQKFAQARFSARRSLI
jgi:hypothetical protein